MKVEVLGQFMLFGATELKRTRVCKECKQRLNIEKFYFTKRKNNKKFYHSRTCIECTLKYQNDYNKKNKKYLSRVLNERISTEEGAINHIYNNIKNKLKSKRTFFKKKNVDISDADIIKYYSCKVTKERLYEIWREQFAKYGMHCPISKQKMTFLRKQAGKQGAGSGYSNTISIDRLDPYRCYEEGNILFIANEVNMRKNKVTYEDCKRIIELHEERFKK